MKGYSFITWRLGSEMHSSLLLGGSVWRSTSPDLSLEMGQIVIP